MYLVEKNITAPEGECGNSKYPFHKMEVGDCFTIPATDPGFYSGTYSGRQKPARRHNAQAASTLYGKRHGMRFVSRMLDDGSCRIWRKA